MVARLRPVARGLGDEDALELVAALAEEGGAERQRETFAVGGMAGVLRELVGETAASAERFRPAAPRVDGRQATSTVR
jgi:hypothetical protein